MKTPFIPAWLDDLPLDPFEMRVLVHIWRRGTLFASLQVTADHLRISKRQLQECLKRLVENGYLTKQERGERTPVEYSPVVQQPIASPAIASPAIASPAIAPHATTIAPHATGYSTTCHQRYSLEGTPLKEENLLPPAGDKLEKKPTAKKTPAQPSDAEPDTFADWWATYPHHPHRRSRKSALVAYRARLKAGRTPDELLAAARKMADDVRAKGDDRQYIPAAERWLSSGKWEGWLAPVAQPPVAQPSVDQMAPDVRRRYEALLQAGVAAEMATA